MEKDIVTIPYYVAEGMIDRQSMTIKRLWILCILLVVLLVGSNAMWLWYESQFDTVTVTQEGENGNNNYIGNDGDINNGTADDNLQTEKNWR